MCIRDRAGGGLRGEPVDGLARVGLLGPAAQFFGADQFAVFLPVVFAVYAPVRHEPQAAAGFCRRPQRTAGGVAAGGAEPFVTAGG